MQTQIGAEALVSFHGSEVSKLRVKKGYRIAEMDEKIRKERTRKEARLLREARRASVNTPSILQESEFEIRLELIDGMKVSEILSSENCKTICGKAGEAAAALHSRGIIHGDLTTSNMILKDNKLFLIDFGLGFFSQRIEDMSHDIRVFKETLRSSHFEVYSPSFEAFESAYKDFGKAQEVIKTLERIESRGRYKIRKKKEGD